MAHKPLGPLTPSMWPTLFAVEIYKNAVFFISGFQVSLNIGLLILQLHRQEPAVVTNVVSLIPFGCSHMCQQLFSITTSTMARNHMPLSSVSSHSCGYHSQRQGGHFPDHMKFPDFSLTILKFPDFSRFSRFARWVATLQKSCTTCCKVTRSQSSALSEHHKHVK